MPAIGERDELRDQFVLTEYNRLWQDFMRSANAIEAWARYFVLLVGAYLAVGTAISGPLRGDNADFSSSGLRALGAGLIALGVIGFFTCVYLANERGARVEALSHMGTIREFMRQERKTPSEALPTPDDVSFVPKFWSGDLARFSIVALLSCFMFFASVSLLVGTKEDGTLEIPSLWPSLSVVAVLVVAIFMHYKAFYWVLDRWEIRYKKHEDERKQRADIDVQAGITSHSPKLAGEPKP